MPSSSTLKFLCLGILLFGSLRVGLAQIERNVANHWYFGNHYGLDFSSGAPQVDLDNSLYAFESACTMSDKDGTLLFYTNGGGRVDSTVLGYIWNRNHEVMEGGELGADLGGGYSASQGVLSFPKPGTAHQYCMFTVDEEETMSNTQNTFPEGKGLSYFEIDMSANAGLGKVVVSNEKLMSPSFEVISGTRHGNCEDYWVIVMTGHRVVENDPSALDSFYLYQVTENGILPPLKTPLPANIDCPGEAGVLHFSPAGDYFYCGNYLFAFDKYTGQIDPPTNLNIFFSPYSVLSFSSNGRFLYQFESVDDGIDSIGLDLSHLYCRQLDLWAPNLFLSIVEVNKIVIPSIGLLSTPQLGPDGKLYLAFHYGVPASPTEVYVVNAPNVKGSAAGFEGPILSLSHDENEIFLRFGNYTDHIFYLDTLTNLSIDIGDTLFYDCENVEIIALAGPPDMDCYLWSTGDTTQSVEVFGEGTYWLEVVKDCELGRDSVEVIYENTLFEIDLGNDTTLCGEETLLIGVNVPDASYDWGNGIDYPFLQVTEAGIYSVEVSIGDCVDRDTIEISYLDYPTIDLATDTVICVGEEVSIVAGTDTTWNYLWEDGSTEPVLTVSEQDIYSVTITNACGEIADSIFVNPVSCVDCTIYIPNIFTPNGDHVNEDFLVYSECVFTYFRLQVFNRWGATLFESRDVNQGWDGTFEGQLNPVGVYVYLLEYELITTRGDRSSGLQSGDVTLMR